MTSRNKSLKSIKQIVRVTAIKYQYNLWKIQVIKKYYKHPQIHPKVAKNEKNKKDMKKTKTLQRKGTEVY